MDHDNDYYEQLSERELEVVRLKVERLSNPQIGDQLFLSKNTVRWYVGQIYSKLDVGNVDGLIQRVEELGLFNEAESPDAPAVLSNLPNPITSFIGREREIVEIRRLLTETRLLTLTGAGGTGKTRLSLRVVENLNSEFSDGIYFINLAPLSDPDMVAKAIADELELVENRAESIGDSLKRVLKLKKCLLILDNFEHVILAAPLVADLLKHTAKLHIMVTSREVLQLYGEHQYSVPPLSLPDIEGTQSLEGLAENEAIQLFVQRAQAVSRRFELTKANARTISEICAHLDGLPLAIELAAAQIKLLNPQAILNRMQNRLDDLKSRVRDQPERQRTIRDSIAWSYDLLDEDEKTLFRRLSVFRGGRSLEACEAVCAERLSIDLIDGLANLVNKNLLVSREDRLGEPRLWMLETIQEYASERLEASGEAEIIHKRHAEFFCDLAEQSVTELESVNQVEWTTRLKIEYDNLRVALSWAVSVGDAELIVRTVNSLHHLWSDTNIYQSDNDYWVYQALEYIEDVRAEFQIELLIILGNNEWRTRMDFLKARHFVEQALAIAREYGDKYLLARSLRFMAGVIMGRPDELTEKLPLDEAMEYCREAIDLLRAIDNKAQLAVAYNILGEMQWMNGDLTDAKETYIECIKVAEEAGDTRRKYINLGNLAGLSRDMGEPEQAKQYAIQALRLAREANDRFMMTSQLSNVFDPIDEAWDATRLLAAMEASLQVMGTTLQPGMVSSFEKAVRTVRDQLGEEAFQQAWDEGSAMSLDEAVAYALGEINPFES